MNVEIGAEAAQFPEKEYINGIAFAVYSQIGSIPLNILKYLTFSWNPLNRIRTFLIQNYGPDPGSQLITNLYLVRLCTWIHVN